jgi:cytoskeletal protein CcmA (bactofilin family)
MDVKSLPVGKELASEDPRPGWTRRILQRRDDEARLAPAEPPSEPVGPAPVVIAAECTMEGRLVSERPVRVEGSYRGSIESADTVVVALDGTVEGDIVARTVVIEGAVVGDVTGRRDVRLLGTGKLHGLVATACFEVVPGAFFNGTTRMHRPQDRRVPDPLTAATD